MLLASVVRTVVLMLLLNSSRIRFYAFRLIKGPPFLYSSSVVPHD